MSLTLHPDYTLQFTVNRAGQALAEYGLDDKRTQQRLEELAGGWPIEKVGAAVKGTPLEKLFLGDAPAPETAPEPVPAAEPEQAPEVVEVPIVEWLDIQRRLETLDRMTAPVVPQKETSPE